MYQVSCAHTLVMSDLLGLHFWLSVDTTVDLYHPCRVYGSVFHHVQSLEDLNVSLGGTRLGAYTVRVAGSGVHHNPVRVCSLGVGRVTFHDGGGILHLKPLSRYRPV